MIINFVFVLQISRVIMFLSILIAVLSRFLTLERASDSLASIPKQERSLEQFK